MNTSFSVQTATGLRGTKIMKDMQNEKNKIKANQQAKNKRSSAEDLATLQTNNKDEVWQYVFHMPEGWAFRKQLAHRTYVAQGECGCVLEIRLTNTPSPMLSLQYKPWGKGCGLLPPHAKGNRSRSNGKARKRQTGNRKSVRSLPKSTKRLSKDSR
jgi:hypothetical protein